MSYEVENLLDRAEQLRCSVQPEAAEKFLERALQLAPNNPNVLDQYADLLLEIGEPERAKALILRSIEIAPGLNPSKYLNLGQTLEGSDAVEAFRKGIQLLTAERDAIKAGYQSGDLDEINAQISSALCSIGEIYMTDLCYDDDAEQQCEKALLSAAEVYPQGPEAHQLLASFKISQQRPQEAIQHLNKSLSLWSNDESSEKPSYDFRVATSKILLELQQPDKASEILDILLLENDEVPEAWSLMGIAESNSNPRSALQYLEKAREMLIGSDDEELVTKTNETYNTVLERVKTLPPEPEPEPEPDNDGENFDDGDDDGMDAS